MELNVIIQSDLFERAVFSPILTKVIITKTEVIGIKLSKKAEIF